MFVIHNSSTGHPKRSDDYENNSKYRKQNKKMQIIVQEEKVEAI